MRKIIAIAILFATMIVLSSCSIYTTTYDDNFELKTYHMYYGRGYRMVYVDNYPYWYRHNVFIPYHHNRQLRHRPSHMIYAKPYVIPNRNIKHYRYYDNRRGTKRHSK